MKKIAAKWGFGNAPLKDAHRKRTVSAIQVVLALLDDHPAMPREEHLEAVSHVKGQFSRSFKQDQWDWFTVWTLLGRPSRKPAQQIAQLLGKLRRALKEQDATEVADMARELKQTRVKEYLSNFLRGGRGDEALDGKSGYIYVLSSREQPHYLKIGMTTRTVEERVREINAATGVVIPFGVRATWHVLDAREAERRIHQALSSVRIRNDREFFEMEFRDALGAINSAIREMREPDSTSQHRSPQ